MAFINAPQVAHYLVINNLMVMRHICQATCRTPVHVWRQWCIVVLLWTVWIGLSEFFHSYLCCDENLWHCCILFVMHMWCTFRCIGTFTCIFTLFFLILGAILGVNMAVNSLIRTVSPTVGGYLLEGFGFVSFGFIGCVQSVLMTLFLAYKFRHGISAPPKPSQTQPAGSSDSKS